MAASKPLIRFETEPREVTVECGGGCDSVAFKLILQTSPLMTTRYAECVKCGKTEPIDRQ